VYSGSVNTGVVGTYTVDYRKVDANGNTGYTSRTVTVEDTTKPVITLNGSSTITLAVHDSYGELSGVVTDNYDTGVQNNLILSGSVDTEVVGTYYVTYNATDAYGNVAEEVMRTVIVQDTDAPTIHLSGANPMYLEVKHAYVEPGYRVEDNYDSTGYFTVTVSGSVNT
jgi:hypothetical protein